jgi:hypothetical protein
MSPSLVVAAAFGQGFARLIDRLHRNKYDGWMQSPASRQRLFTTTLVELVQQSTVAVFAGWGEHPPLKHASGVLFQIADVGFLLTAAHVMEDSVRNGVPYFLSGWGQKLLPLDSGVCFRTTAPASSAGSEDLADLAAFRLGQS